MECLQHSEKLFESTCDGALQNLMGKCKFSVSHTVLVIDSVSQALASPRRATPPADVDVSVQNHNEVRI